MKKLQVEIGKVLYFKNGWGIFGCRPIEKGESKGVILNNFGSFTVKGNSFELTEGDRYTIEIEDEPEVDKNDRITYLLHKVHVPKTTSINAQYNFMESILTAKQYKDLCKTFPPSKKIKIMDAIKNGEVDLTTVKGIGTSVAEKIKEKIIAKEDKLQVINKLHHLGVSDTVVDKVISHFGGTQATVIKINQSMYNLCEVKGLGFLTVDKYAQAGGENPTSFKRIEACINYLVHELAKEGHSWTNVEDMIKQSNKLLEIDESHIESFLGTLDLLDDSNLILVNDNQVTNKYYYQTEKELYNHLKRIDSNYRPNFNHSVVDNAIKNAEEKLNIVYTDEQLSVIKESFENGIYIINGKAGTGKSTIMKGITEICNALGWSYQAVALSGRAAQLLTLKGINASTIHRLLGSLWKKDDEDENEEDKKPKEKVKQLHQKVIILEEASMVNAQLWHELVRAIPDGSKLIIVGDSGQLSAIGNGDVLRDLLANKKFNGKELQQIHRQAKDSGIIEVASKVREGENVTGYNWELSNSYGVNNDLFIFTYNDKNVLLNSAYSIIDKRMNDLDEKGILDFQILVANKQRGNFSTLNINKRCQSIYNDLNKPFVKNHSHEFREGDKVIINGNKYSSTVFTDIDDYNNSRDDIGDEEKYVGSREDLFNGTIGLIQYIDDEKGYESVLVDFEGIDGLVYLNKDIMSDLDLAYAITCHKAQGYGCPNVLILLDFGAFKLLSKQLVYTAITRASQKCVVLAENNSLLKATQIDASGLRNTFVGQLIQQDKSF